MGTIKISVIIPCYNCEKMIEQVADRINRTIAEKKEYSWEIILINDGSVDKTWNVIKNMAEHDPHIKAVNFSKNFGQHSAMMAGYRMATGDLIVGMDDDGENRPEELFMLIDKLNEGYDCVCAEYESHTSFFRSIGTRVNNWMACYMLDKPKDFTLTSYYVVKRFVIDQAIKYEHSYPYIAGLFLQASNNWGTVRLQRSERISGRSGYNIRKLLNLWINGFTAFSVKPLRLASGLGAFFAMLGIIWGIVLVIRKLCIGNVVMGYTSLMAALSFFCGMIMLLLGFVGEYIGRIYISINNSPQYVIKEYIDLEKMHKETEDAK